MEPLAITSIKGPRAFEEIVSQLKDAIYGGRLKPGDKLPSERELANQFEASRVTVREAIRSLEHAGFVAIKRGYSGGSYILDPDLKPFKNSLSTFLRLRKATIGDLTEARLLLETRVAGLAALRATEEDLRKLDEAVRQHEKTIQTGKLPHKYNLEFHRDLAEASHNPVLGLIVNSVADLLIEEVVSKLDLDLATNQSNLDFHRQIYQAIKNHQEHEAEEIMREHILEVQRRLQELLTDTVGEPRHR